MAINTGGLQTHSGGFTGGAVYTSQVTTSGTANVVELDPKDHSIYLAMGTEAANRYHNQYALASTTSTATDSEIADGLDVWVIATATGSAYLQIHGGTATGDLHFTTAAMASYIKRMGGVWHIVSLGGATIATSTATEGS